MNGVLLVLIVLVIAAIGVAVYASSKASGRRSRGLAGRRQGRRPPRHRTPRRSGAQPDRLRRRVQAGARRRLRALHRRRRRRSTRRRRPSRPRWPRRARSRACTTCAPPASRWAWIPGPELESLAGQRSAGAVTEDRRVDFEGREIEASPGPSQRTPNYYPGGRVAGRPVPAGWYSEPWWKPALVAGAWGLGSVLLFDALFSGMHGVDYGAQGFEQRLRRRLLRRHGGE